MTAKTKKKTQAELDEEARVADLKETRERQAELNRQWKSHPRAESHFTVPAMNKDGDEKDKPVEVHAEGDRVVLNSHGEARLDSAAVVRLMKHLQEAFQVVA